MNHRNTVNLGGVKQLSFYVADLKMNLACNIFCETMELAKEWKKKNPGKPFQYSKAAEKLARSDHYAGRLAQFGMKAEVNIFVKVTSTLKTALGTTSRKIYENSAVMKRLGTQAAKILGKAGARLGVSVATGAAGGSVVPGPGTAAGAVAGTVVGVGMAIWTAVDLYSLAKDALPLAKDIVKGLGQALNVKPDLVILDEGGRVKEIFDYKFPKDRYQDGQEKIFKEAAPDGSETVNLKNCNKCKAKGP